MPVKTYLTILSILIFISASSFADQTTIPTIIDKINKNINFIKSIKKEHVLSTIIISLIIQALCLKHPGFKEEQEWRIIYLPNILPPTPNNIIHNS